MKPCTTSSKKVKQDVTKYTYKNKIQELTVFHARVNERTWKGRKVESRRKRKVGLRNRVFRHAS